MKDGNTELVLALQNIALAIQGSLDTSWQTPSLQNGWLEYSGGFQQSGYMIDKNGFVHLRGLIKSGTIGATIFTLPVGYRPATTLIFAAVNSSSVGRVDVASSGTVTLSASYAAGNAFLSLDGITFMAQQ